MGKRKQTTKPLAADSETLPTVRVRMYRQGLGDCILLIFETGTEKKHILIDCGTLGATENKAGKKVKVENVLKNIAEDTKGHLDLVVATHEHSDHVGGFLNWQTLRSKNKLAITVDRVWMAWTEDPTDSQAKEIAKYEEELGAAALAAIQAMRATGDEQYGKQADAVTELLEFSGPLLGADGFSARTNEAMEYVRTKISGGGKSPTKYLSPGGTPIAPDWLPGFRFYVLGPPRDPKYLDNPGDHGSNELYGLMADVLPALRFRGSAGDYNAYRGTLEPTRELPEFEDHMPFDARFRLDMQDESVQARFAPSYFAEDAEWRRIDHDWLMAGSEFALQRDNLTNNTSLALAIERMADGKVLIFPGDAQLGNWLSWHDEKTTWRLTGKDGKERTVNARDLLARTVFYKVGHHGSHNATAREQGLELMGESGDLIAFIPVDRAVALNKGWLMPARALYRRLLEKCTGRVMRTDLGWAADANCAKSKKVEEEFLGLATDQEWTKWAKAQGTARPRITSTEMFIEYRLD